jgi:hypothetical protein
VQHSKHLFEHHVLGFAFISILGGHILKKCFGEFNKQGEVAVLILQCPRLSCTVKR